MSIADTLFDEQEAEQIKGEPYNPVMTADQLRTTTPDATLATASNVFFVHCRARVRENNYEHVFDYYKLTDKVDELVFTTGPVMTTELVSTTLVTPENLEVLRGLIRE